MQRHRCRGNFVCPNLIKIFAAPAIALNGPKRLILLMPHLRNRSPVHGETEKPFFVHGARTAWAVARETNPRHEYKATENMPRQLHKEQ